MDEKNTLILFYQALLFSAVIEINEGTATEWNNIQEQGTFPIF